MFMDKMITLTIEWLPEFRVDGISDVYKDISASDHVYLAFVMSPIRIHQ